MFHLQPYFIFYLIFTSIPFLEIWIIFSQIWENTIHISKIGDENEIWFKENEGRNKGKNEVWMWVGDALREAYLLGRRYVLGSI